MVLKKIPSVRFILSQSKDKDRESYIHMYFHYAGGKRLKYSTGHKVYPGQWDTKRRRVIVTRNFPQAVDINEDLDRLSAYTMRIYRDTNMGEIEPGKFSRRLDVLMGYARPEPEEKGPTLLSFAESYVTKYAADHPQKRNTWKVMFLAVNQLKEYGIQNATDLEFSEITKAFFDEFILWLYAPPRQYSRNYVAGVIKRTKLFMQRAYEAGLHNNKQFLGVRMPEVPSDEIALFMDDLKKLSDLDLSKNKRLERARDLFLVGCFTGLRISDYGRIKPEHIVTENGLQLISIITDKTGAKVKIPLYPILEKLLTKYNFALPVMERESEKTIFNNDVKSICKLAGFTEKILIRENKAGHELEKEVLRYSKVSTHTARRSFATNFILLGVPIHYIMAILGHKTEAQTRAYARISQSMYAQGFSLEMEKLRSSPQAALLFE